MTKRICWQLLTVRRTEAAMGARFSAIAWTPAKRSPRALVNFCSRGATGGYQTRDHAIDALGQALV